jgi:hypothetical protein
MADMKNTDTLKALFDHMFALGYKAESDMYTRNGDGETEKYSLTSEYSWYGKDTDYEAFFSRMVIFAPAKFEVRFYEPGADETPKVTDQILQVVVPVYCTEAHRVTDTSWGICEKQIDMLTTTFWHDCEGGVIRDWFRENNTFAIKSFDETLARKRTSEYEDLNYMAARLNAMVGILLGDIRFHDSVTANPQCFNETLRVSRALGKLQGAVLPRVKGILVNKHAVDYGWRD